MNSFDDQINQLNLAQNVNFCWIALLLETFFFNHQDRSHNDFKFI